MYDFKQTIEQEKRRIEATSQWIDDLNITEKYKCLFLEFNSSRGIQTLHKFREYLEFIAERDCAFIDLLLRDKVCGIETVHKIASLELSKDRELIYDAIREKGVKNINIDALLLAPRQGKLF